MSRLPLERTSVAVCALASALVACQTLLDFDPHARAGTGDGGTGDGGAPTSGYVRTISITASPAGALESGLTIRIPLDALADAVASGKVRRDYADLHVFGPAGELHRVVDSAPTFASDAAWIALAGRVAPGATDTSYSLVYGAATGGAPLADGQRVFRLFDDFESATLGSVWLTNDGPSIDRGMLVLRALHDDAITTRDGVVAATSTFEARVRVLTREPDAGDPTHHYWLGFQRQGDFGTQSPWVLWNSRTPSTIRPEIDESIVGPEVPQTAAFRVYGVDRDPQRTTFSIDGAVRFVVDHANDVALSPMVRDFQSTDDLEIDWIRVRTRVSPEPVVTVGPEQPAR